MFSNKCTREETEVFVTVNNVLANGASLSEECFMELITKQCLTFMTYSCCNWSINNECKRQVNVCFNKTIRRVLQIKIVKQLEI